MFHAETPQGLVEGTLPEFRIQARYIRRRQPELFRDRLPRNAVQIVFMQKIIQPQEGLVAFVGCFFLILPESGKGHAEKSRQKFRSRCIVSARFLRQM